jgi:phosphate/sulfate permease
MIVTMSSTVVFLWLTAPLKGVILSAVFMFLVAVWAWRYPDTVEEHQRRKDNGEKIGWLK